MRRPNQFPDIDDFRPALADQCPPDDAFAPADPWTNAEKAKARKQATTIAAALAAVADFEEKGPGEALAGHEAERAHRNSYQEYRWQQAKAAMEEERRLDALARVLRESEVIKAVASKLFKPVHVEGGPCIDSAPEDETFLPLGHPDITCPECLAVAALCHGDGKVLSPEQADPYSKAVYAASMGAKDGPVITTGAAAGGPVITAVAPWAWDQSDGVFK